MTQVKDTDVHAALSQLYDRIDLPIFRQKLASHQPLLASLGIAVESMDDLLRLRQNAATLGAAKRAFVAQHPQTGNPGLDALDVLIHADVHRPTNSDQLTKRAALQLAEDSEIATACLTLVAANAQAQQQE